MEKEIREIADLVEQLRIEDSDLRVFGADAHKYRIGPKLSEQEICDFEREHGIVLPPDYRLWLQLVGNGSGLKVDGLNGRWRIAGSGPDYGIYNLQDTAIATNPEKPFNLILLPPDVSEPDKRTYESDDDEELTGMLEMVSKGCADKSYLVVNGEGYGTIWDGSEGLFWPTGLSFSQWMRKWAEDSLPRVIRERITNLVEEGMTKAQVIEICGDKWGEVPLFGAKLLRFKDLATDFCLDENDRVSRVIRHSIS